MLDGYLSTMSSTDVSVLILREALGLVFLAHGLNHIFGGGRLPGTARWFASLGMRPGYLHAVVASVVEVTSGALLVLGLFTPAACAGVVGTMTVAWVISHARNGFFVFRPGEGYEYVMVLVAAGLCVAGIGPGRVSVDHIMQVDDPGWLGLGIGVAGAIGAALLLGACWRPRATTAHSPASGPQSVQ